MSIFKKEEKRTTLAKEKDYYFNDDILLLDKNLFINRDGHLGSNTLIIGDLQSIPFNDLIARNMYQKNGHKVVVDTNSIQTDAYALDMARKMGYKVRVVSCENIKDKPKYIDKIAVSLALDLFNPEPMRILIRVNPNDSLQKEAATKILDKIVECRVNNNRSMYLDTTIFITKASALYNMNHIIKITNQNRNDGLSLILCDDSDSVVDFINDNQLDVKELGFAVVVENNGLTAEKLTRLNELGFDINNSSTSKVVKERAFTYIENKNKKS